MITEKEVEDLAYKEARLQFHPQWSKDEFVSCVVCFKEGFKQAIEMSQPMWTPVIKDELLPAGYYYLKLRHPDTNIEDVIICRIQGIGGKITHHFATEYCRLPEPPNH